MSDHTATQTILSRTILDDRSVERRRPRLVVVDDDCDDHLLIAEAADEAGLDIEFTFLGSGESLAPTVAELTARNERPDLVLVDLRMPRVDGCQAVAALRAIPMVANIPVVVFSSSLRPSDRDRALAAGAEAYESKPSDFDELVKLVKRLARDYTGTESPAPTSPVDTCGSPRGGYTRHDDVFANLLARVRDE